MTGYSKIALIVIFLSIMGCGKYYNKGELTGSSGHKKYFEPQPYGMVSIPTGSFTLGLNDGDILNSMNTDSKVVSISSFWMDETEITNDEYKQFVSWVQDSIIRQRLADQYDEFLLKNRKGEPYDPPRLDWKAKIDPRNDEYRDAVEDLYYSDVDRLGNAKEFDKRKLIYSYSWIDYASASKVSLDYENDEYRGTLIDNKGDTVNVKGRSSFIMRERTNIYPDTLCWLRDFSYSYNDPFVRDYFSHPGFNNYPVVGVSWVQAKAFCHWRTGVYNANLGRNMAKVMAYRLPTEAEWEYAARGGLSGNLYPWGGPYTRNKKGCFLANFKPLRGNYVSDGGLRTLAVGSYEPNGFGLYDMAGNVAEWTSTAYNESGYDFVHDMNPDYGYNALPGDPPSLKRKVIRGGSWKDIYLFLQCGTRSYEYQDTTKSYIGFRCVRSKIKN